MTLELRRPKTTPGKEAEEAERKRRLRDAVVLCMNFMISQGYIDSAERLAQESGIPSDRYEICDNINFNEILIEYESFQELKYGQKPKLTKLSPKSQSSQQTKKGGIIPQQKDDGRPPRVIKPKLGQLSRANQIEPLDQDQNTNSNLPQTSNSAQRPTANQKKKE